MPIIKLITIIKTKSKICFDLSRDLNLHQKAFASSSEKAIAGKVSGLIGEGEEVTWRGKHFGIYHTHTSKITQFDSPHYFRDEMIQGRFKTFIHDHYFKEVECGTEMKDVLEFSSPLGHLGKFIDKIILTSYLTQMLQERNEMIKRVAESFSGHNPSTK